MAYDPDLSRQENRVLKAFSGGKTVEEVLEALGGKPGIRQLRSIMRKLMSLGKLIDRMKGKRGPLPHIYIPADDLVYPERRQSIKPGISKEDYELGRAVWLVHNRICTAMCHIRYKDAWRRRRRIPSVCESQVKLVVKDIIHLWKAGFRVTPPWEFFNDPEQVRFREIYRSTRLEGTIGIRRPGSSREEDWVFPSLIEWDQYFRKTLSELGELATAHIGILMVKAKPDDSLESKFRENYRMLEESGIL